MTAAQMGLIRNPSPTLPDDDAPHLPSADAVLVSQLAHEYTVPTFAPNLGRVVSGDLRVGIPLPVETSTFSGLVGGIVRLSSEKEMRRIHATRVVALVAYPHPVGNFTPMEHPRKAVSSNLPIAAPNETVSLWGSVSGPFPACLGIGRITNAICESDLYRQRMRAGTRTEATSALARRLKSRAASFADGWDRIGSRHFLASMSGRGVRHCRGRVQPLPGFLLSELYQEGGI